MEAGAGGEGAYSRQTKGLRGGFLRGALQASQRPCDDSVDLDLARDRRGFLRQRELEDAVGELRRGAGLVQLDRERETARALAEEALGAQPLVAFGGLGIAARLGRERHFVALDLDRDVFLLHARQLGVDGVGLGRFAHVDADGQRLGAGLEGHGGTEEVVQEPVEAAHQGLVARERVAGHVHWCLHDWMVGSGRTAPCRKSDAVAGEAFKGPGSDSCGGKIRLERLEETCRTARHSCKLPWRASSRWASPRPRRGPTRRPTATSATASPRRARTIAAPPATPAPEGRPGTTSPTNGSTCPRAPARRPGGARAPAAPAPRAPSSPLACRPRSRRAPSASGCDRRTMRRSWSRAPRSGSSRSTARISSSRAALPSRGSSASRPRGR